MGRISTVKSHPQRAQIDQALADGETYAQIADAHGLSLAAVGRYALQQRPELARLAAGEPSAVDLVSRLLAAADDAGELRRLSRISGTPAARARAIKTETDVIRVLLTELGVSDETTQLIYSQTSSLVKFLHGFGRQHPDTARSLFMAMAGDADLEEIGTALARSVPTINS